MLIGLTGKKGVGKDTLGQYLIDNYEFRKLAFADPLKQAVANLFSITVEEVDAFKQTGFNTETHVKIHRYEEKFSFPFATWTWREFLQRFGTEMGRDTFGQDFWVDQWSRHIDPEREDNVVVTDVRFDNEALRINRFGGYIVEIVRGGHVSDGHKSEEGIEEDFVDALITNNGTLEDLYKDVDKLMEDITSGAYH